MALGILTSAAQVRPPVAEDTLLTPFLPADHYTNEFGSIYLQLAFKNK